VSAFGIREEKGGDREAVTALIASAFHGRPYASGTEARIHAALHEAGAATLALVAEEEGCIVGQVVFSPLTLDGDAWDWHGLGPVGVAPDRQGQGIGGGSSVRALRSCGGSGREGA
jgi:putative acetyltransferase